MEMLREILDSGVEPDPTELLFISKEVTSILYDTQAELEDTVGGGVSQFTTTLYNAVFWGGYEDVEHKPHSYYFSRYPEGVEATLNWRSPDLKFRNNTDRAILIDTRYTDTSITVRMFGENDGRTLKGEQSEGRSRAWADPEGGPNAIELSDQEIVDLMADYTVNLGVEHTFQLASGATLTPRFNIYASDDIEFQERGRSDPPTPCNQDAWTKLGARMTYEPAAQQDQEERQHLHPLAGEQPEYGSSASASLKPGISSVTISTQMPAAWSQRIVSRIGCSRPPSSR